MNRILTMTSMLALATLAGCIGGAEASSTLYVKDALTDDVDEVHVTFTSAQVKPVDGGWQTVFEGKETIDLLALSAADAKAALGSFDLAEGQYEGLRIAVSEVEVVYPDGTTEMLNVFGNLVQVSDDFSVGADGIDILVDFDLEAGVDLEAATYTPVVKNIQTSDDDADGDGIDDVEDTDDDNDGDDDASDDDIDGDGDDDKPRQVYAENSAEACAAERDEELMEAQEELNESMAEAAAERDEAYAEADEQYQEDLLNGNLTQAEANRDAAYAEADEEYEEAVAEAQAEYDEEVAEIDEEHDECLVDDEDDEDDADDEDSESDEESEDTDEE